MKKQKQFWDLNLNPITMLPANQIFNTKPILVEYIKISQYKYKVTN